MNRFLPLPSSAFIFLFLFLAACQAPPETVAEETAEVTTTAVEVSDDNDTDFSSRPVAIGLMVADLDAAVNFYQNILGLPSSGGFDLDGDFGTRSGLTDNQPISVKTFTFGKGETATTLKLVASPPVEAHTNSSFIHDDNSVQYLTVYVKEMAPFLERLRAANIPFRGQTPINIGDADNERAFVLVQDPDGTFVELIEE